MLLVATTVVIGTGAGVSAQRPPTVAAAANLNFALTEIANQFKVDRGTSVEVVFGASGTLTRQIQDGAPFELFLAADEEFPNQLAKAGLTRDAGVVYAVGRLVIFAPNGSPLTVDERLNGLARVIKSGKAGRFAIANPDVAPYGKAAESVLRKRGLWDAIRPQLVLGDTIAQAAQFATTGNAIGGLVAYSLGTRSGVRRAREVRGDSGDRSPAAPSADGAPQTRGRDGDAVLRLPAGRDRARHSSEARVRSATIAAMDWTALRVSLWLGAGTIAILLPFGIWFGRLLAIHQFRGKVLVEALVTVPLVLPPTVLGFYLLVMFGARSPLGQAFQSLVGQTLPFSFEGLLLASAIANIPFVVQPIQRGFEAIPSDVRDAAACCGLTPWQRFARIEVPLAWPGILTAAILAFAHTLGEFGVVLMVGGNLPGETRTLSVAIYDRMQAFDDRSAGVMAATLLVIAVATLMLTTTLSRRVGVRRG